MKFTVENMPVFATEAAKICTLRADEPFGGLTIQEAEKLMKTWFYETLMELRQPPEAKVTFFTRKTAAKELNISPKTLDELIEKTDTPYHWLGNRRILLRDDLNSLIKTENIYNDDKNKS